MSTSLELFGVTLDYPVYSVSAKSLRSSVMNLAVGGRLMKDQSDTAVVRALTNIAFKIEEGDRLAIIGHNGAGKTTLLKVIAGIYEPTEGVVDVKGRLTSMISVGLGMDPEASGIQNIYNMALMRLVRKSVIKERIPSIVEFAELGAFINLPVRTYSAGMVARLNFGVATELDADILVLDEWMGAGDAAFHDKAAKRMERFVASAKMIVVGTHNLGLVRDVCNKVCVLDGGRMSYFGPVEEYFERLAAA
ncbi:MAG: ABC transporter ATP-binding protein [Proteobacteria bacterium]|nr:ABC transporter ATP-binding protein [Pseudomonadota bacterium]MBW3617610.1 ABC transporter ATP-binding protein [Pseudomonadota bacterium]